MTKGWCREGVQRTGHLEKHRHHEQDAQANERHPAELMPPASKDLAQHRGTAADIDLGRVFLGMAPHHSRSFGARTGSGLTGLGGH